MRYVRLLVANGSGWPKPAAWQIGGRQVRADMVEDVSALNS